MKNLALSALVTVFSISAVAQTTADVRPDRSLRVPSKMEVSREVKAYRALADEALKKDNAVDPMVFTIWAEKAGRLEKGLAGGPTAMSPAEFVDAYYSLAAFNTALRRNVEDGDRILVLECCHNVKTGKVCDSLSEAQKKDLDKCKGSKK